MILWWRTTCQPCVDPEKPASKTDYSDPEPDEPLAQCASSSGLMPQHLHVVSDALHPLHLVLCGGEIRLEVSCSHYKVVQTLVKNGAAFVLAIESSLDVFELADDYAEISVKCSYA